MTADDKTMDMVLALAENPKSMYPADGMDRHAEFRQLFSTDAGSRVFKEIMIQGRVFTNNAAKGDPYETYLNNGMRNMALIIAKITFEEPVIPPTTQVSRNPEGG